VPHSLKPTHVMRISCPDARGIVASVSGFLAHRKCFISRSDHFGDPDTKRFFMRVLFAAEDPNLTIGALLEAFQDVREDFDMDVSVHDLAIKPNVLVMVSKAEHCLNDLLYRYRTGALRMAIPAIVSNHMDLAPLADWHKVPFFHVPINAATKPKAEARLKEIIEQSKADLVVLARYMQVLSGDLSAQMAGRVINIHHSFLPSFKGARPYDQAHARGVKLIGATAHYVTGDLDEGPIIEQTVERVDHTRTVEDLVAIGRDLECLALHRALKAHLEHRVFLNGTKTVVFQ
jgi:formyltetrahydrofolate deformylase